MKEQRYEGFDFSDLKRYTDREFWFLRGTNFEEYLGDKFNLINEGLYIN